MQENSADPGWSYRSFQMRYPLLFESVTATGTGAAPRRKKAAGLDIVVTKYIGMEAAALLKVEKEAQLLARFPRVMVEKAKRLREASFYPSEAGATAGKSWRFLLQAVREGGASLPGTGGGRRGLHRSDENSDGSDRCGNLQLL